MSSTLAAAAHRAIAVILLFAATSPPTMAATAEQKAKQLWNAAFGGNLDAVRTLLDQGVPVDARDERGRTALAAAASNGKTEVFHFLLERGADPSARSDDGASVLSAAVYGSELSVVQLLIERTGDAAKDQGLFCPLGIAAMKNRVDVAQALLDAGAVVPVGPADCRPLHRAAANGRLEVLELLVDRGASVDTRNDEGNTPLHFAAAYNATEAVTWLLARGADPGAKNQDGLTPLEVARKREATESIVALGGPPAAAAAPPLPLQNEADRAAAARLDALAEDTGRTYWHGIEKTFGGPVSADEPQRVEFPGFEIGDESIACRGAFLITILDEYTDEVERHHKVTTTYEDGTECDYRGKTFVFSSGVWGVRPPTEAGDPSSAGKPAQE